MIKSFFLKDRLATKNWLWSIDKFHKEKDIKSVYIRNVNGQKINKDIYELVRIQIIKLVDYLPVFSRVYKLEYRVLNFESISLYYMTGIL